VVVAVGEELELRRLMELHHMDKVELGMEGVVTKSDCIVDLKSTGSWLTEFPWDFEVDPITNLQRRQKSHVKVLAYHDMALVEKSLYPSADRMGKY
jgi:hypothetical protein